MVFYTNTIYSANVLGCVTDKKTTNQQKMLFNGIDGLFEKIHLGFFKICGINTVLGVKQKNSCMPCIVF